jgi:acetyl-CoA carboxylase carboxyltransferase component
MQMMAELTDRELARHALDPGTFLEDFPEASDDVIAGTGAMAGHPVGVAVIAAMGPLQAGRPDRPYGREKLFRLQERAQRTGLPLIYFFRPLPDCDYEVESDELGDWSDPGVMLADRRGLAKVWANQIGLAGVAPQVGVVLGPHNGPRSFPAALCDLLLMVGTRATLSLGNPKQIAAMLGREVTLEDIAGASMHASISGMADGVVESTEAAIEWVRSLVGFLPDGGWGRFRSFEPVDPKRGPAFEDIVPVDHAAAFDMIALIERIVDEGSLLEVKRQYAKEIVTGFARIAGRPLGIVANNSLHRGGLFFVETCNKAARFVSLCDSYGLPIVFLADTAGFMTGDKSEQEGILHAGAKLFSAIYRSAVPKISVVVRKAHTAGVKAMCGPPFEPEAFIAVEGAAISIFGMRAVSRMSEESAAKQRFYERMLQSSDPHSLAKKLIVDEVVTFGHLRDALVARLARAQPRKQALPVRPVWFM